MWLVLGNFEGGLSDHILVYRERSHTRLCSMGKKRRHAVEQTIGTKKTGRTPMQRPVPKSAAISQSGAHNVAVFEQPNRSVAIMPFFGVVPRARRLLEEVGRRG